jgi:hypothetical protein
MKLAQILSFLLILGISMNAFPEHYIEDGKLATPQKETLRREQAKEVVNKNDYEIFECGSDGVCKGRHKVTGEIRLFKGDEAIVQAGATDNKATQTPKEAKDILTKEELEFWQRKDTTTVADFKKMIAISNKLGKKYVVIQVGNLAGCPPCQALDASIKAAEVGKKQNADIVDFNYYNNRGNDLAQYMQNHLTLPQQFSFPYVYVFQLKEGWIDYYKMIPNTEASVSKIESSMQELKATAEAAAKSKK